MSHGAGQNVPRLLMSQSINAGPGATLWLGVPPLGGPRRQSINAEPGSGAAAASETRGNEASLISATERAEEAPGIQPPSPRRGEKKKNEKISRPLPRVALRPPRRTALHPRLQPVAPPGPKALDETELFMRK